MEKVLAKTHSSSTDTTFVTVVYRLALAVFPQLANVTVVVGGNLTAVNAHIRSLLRRSTDHTEHVFRLGADEIVILVGVMTETACIPFLAGEALQFNVPLIMLAPKSLLVLFFGFRHGLGDDDRGIASMTLW